MEIKQSTIDEILDSEHQMILTGADRYGEFFTNAFGFNNVLNNFIKSVDDPEKYLFVAFLSQVRKHHTLALFSAARLHHMQTGMNLRQVLEASAWAAYAMAFKEEGKFFEKDAKGVVLIPDKLTVARNQWLEQNFKIKSDELKNLKNIINKSTAHSSIAYAFQNFEMGHADRPGFHTPFFDFEDDYKVKSDLWFVANMAMGILDLFYGVNLKFKVFQVAEIFKQNFQPLVDQNNNLKAEMEKHERYAAAKKLNES